MNITESLLNVIDSIETKVENGEMEVSIEFSENQTEEEVNEIKDFIINLISI